MRLIANVKTSSMDRYVTKGTVDRMAAKYVD
jgi:hypothetical protein